MRIVVHVVSLVRMHHRINRMMSVPSVIRWRSVHHVLRMMVLLLLLLLLKMVVAELVVWSFVHLRHHHVAGSVWWHDSVGM